MADKPVEGDGGQQLRFEGPTPLADYNESRSVLVKDDTGRSPEPDTIDFDDGEEIFGRTGDGSAGQNTGDSQTSGNGKTTDDERTTGDKPKEGRENNRSTGDASDKAPQQLDAATGDGKFIAEEVSDKLLKKLEEMKIPKETAENVLREINQFGQDPQEVLQNLMKKNRVLAIGESHQSPNPQRDLVTQSMADLKTAGATHLAIEAPMRIQPALDEFMRTGKLDPKELPPLLRDADFMKMLEAARTNGLKIVSVDRDGRYQEGTENPDRPQSGDNEPYVDRDKLMSENIGQILDADPKNKVVFFVGSAHLDRNDPSRHQSAADNLRAKYDTATIKPIYENFRGLPIYPLPEITDGLKGPVAVNTSQAKTLGSLPESKFNDLIPRFEKDWDYVIAYPNTRRN